MIPPTSMSGAFQFGYVVRDMELAVASFANTHRITGFRVATFDLNLSFPSAPTRLTVGLTWVDDHEIELIQPIIDGTGVFGPAIPSALANCVFHHIAMRVPGELEDWDRFRATIDNERVVMAGSREGMRFIYVDERGTLGHYVEYIWMNGEYLKSVPWRTPPSHRGQI